MAGLGYKDFTAGAVLTAAQVDGYLMEQAVMNFAGTAARGSALSGVVAAGMVAHVGAGTLTVYDGSAWQQVYPTSGGGAFKNLLYNGAMQVSQRGTSTTSITTSGYYTADRWYQSLSSLGTWTQSVDNDAPTGSGFRKSLKILCTTADASPAASDFAVTAQFLEGQDLQRIAKGTSSAQQLTLSFWVKSNVTGTYIAELHDNDNSRRVSASYTISASATWERKTITFPADTTGAFDNDNASSLAVYFYLASGSSYTSSPLQTTWGTATTNIATGQTNLAAATNNYWQITGVQLEVGSQATAFEFKSFGQELRECQRYYFRRSAAETYSVMVPTATTATTTSSEAFVQFPVPMRAVPTSLDISNVGWRVAGGTLYTLTSPAISANGGSTNACVLNGTVSSQTAEKPGSWMSNNNAAAYLGLSAEL